MRYFVELENLLPKIGANIVKSVNEPDYPSIDITKSVMRKSSGSTKERVQNRYYVMTDIAGEPISGTLTAIRPNSGRFIDITKDYLEQANIDPYLLDENAIYAFIITGHSNASNMSYDARPASYINENINNNKKVQWNTSLTEMEIADNIMTDAYDRLVQKLAVPGEAIGLNNPNILMSNELSRIIKRKTGKTIQFITISGSRNGSMIDHGSISSQPELSNNSVNFQVLQQGLEEAKAYADSINKTLKVPFVIVMNGEVEGILYNSTPESSFRYKKTLHQYKRNLKKMISDITGDPYDFPIFRHQLHGQQMTDDNNMNVKQFVYESSYKDNLVVTPTYQVNINAGFDHWDTEATFRVYGTMTNRIYQFHYQKSGIVFEPTKITTSTNSIRIELRVPKPPIRIDTSRGLEQYHGFTVKDSNGVEIPISNIELENEAIILTTVSNPTGGTLFYKLKRNYPSPVLQRYASYIADNDNIKFTGFDMPNYLISFKKTL